MVVVRYDIASGASTLWVNPRPKATLAPRRPISGMSTSINAWAFRQSSTANGHMGRRASMI
jgi:hypothetical protein